MRVSNTAPDIDRLAAYLLTLAPPCVIAFEPTGDYHRALMHRLGQAGFALHQVSSLAVARTRDAMSNSWDKNDPKNAQVILHLLKTGTTQRFVDALVSGYHDLQEMANTYQQVSSRKVRPVAHQREGVKLRAFGNAVNLSDYTRKNARCQHPQMARPGTSLEA